MKAHLSIIIFALIASFRLSSCDEKPNYSQDQLKNELNHLDNNMFVKLSIGDSLKLVKLSHYCMNNCVPDYSDMHAEINICCYLRYYIQARLYGSQLIENYKFENLYMMADSLSSSNSSNLTYISILMNKYIENYFSRDELISIFPIQKKYIRTKKVIVEKVMLRFESSQDTIGVQKLFDKLGMIPSTYARQ